MTTKRILRRLALGYLAALALVTALWLAWARAQGTSYTQPTPGTS